MEARIRIEVEKLRVAARNVRSEYKDIAMGLLGDAMELLADFKTMNAQSGTPETLRITSPPCHPMIPQNIDISNTPASPKKAPNHGCKKQTKRLNAKKVFNSSSYKTQNSMAACLQRLPSQQLEQELKQYTNDAPQNGDYLSGKSDESDIVISSQDEPEPPQNLRFEIQNEKYQPTAPVNGSAMFEIPKHKQKWVPHKSCNGSPVVIKKKKHIVYTSDDDQPAANVQASPAKSPPSKPDKFKARSKEAQINAPQTNQSILIAKSSFTDIQKGLPVLAWTPGSRVLSQTEIESIPIAKAPPRDIGCFIAYKQSIVNEDFSIQKSDWFVGEVVGFQGKNLIHLKQFASPETPTVTTNPMVVIAWSSLINPRIFVPDFL